MLIIIAAVIAFAVVYNNARIALAERSRELASLRVLGFHAARGVAHPARRACVLHERRDPARLRPRLRHGRARSWARTTDLMRIPLIVQRGPTRSPVTVASRRALSALIVRRRIDHLDLVAVLKTRD